MFANFILKAFDLMLLSLTKIVVCFNVHNYHMNRVTKEEYVLFFFPFIPAGMDQDLTLY